MGAIAFPEVLVIVVSAVLYLAVPVVVMALVVRWVVARQIASSMVASRPCGQCGQRIPDIGSFCPMCGNRLA